LLRLLNAGGGGGILCSDCRCANLGLLRLLKGGGGGGGGISGADVGLPSLLGASGGRDGEYSASYLERKQPMKGRWYLSKFQGKNDRFSRDYGK
jgi:hypothetical protein